MSMIEGVVMGLEQLDRDELRRFLWGCSDDVYGLLLKYFGIKGFREKQGDLMNSILTWPRPPGSRFLCPDCGHVHGTER